MKVTTFRFRATPDDQEFARIFVEVQRELLGFGAAPAVAEPAASAPDAADAARASLPADLTKRAKCV